MREPNIPDTLAYFSPAFYCTHLCDSRTLVVSASPLCPASGTVTATITLLGLPGAGYAGVGDLLRHAAMSLKDPNGAADLDY